MWNIIKLFMAFCFGYMNGFLVHAYVSNMDVNKNSIGYSKYR